MVSIKNDKGFTLIEVLIAMAILSVGLLGTAALITGIIKGNQISNRLTIATTLAQDKMEEIKGDSYSNAVTETKAFLPSPDDQYEREVTVDDSSATDMKTVTVTVYWGSDKSVVLQTILSR